MKVLFFKAPWCSACHVVDPYVPQEIERIDCEESPDAALAYNVTTLPIFIAIKDDGTEIARIKTTSIPVLNNWIKDRQNGN